MTTFERIKEISKKKGYSLTKLNDAAGLGTNSIYHWRNKTPSTDSLQKVANVLNVSLDYLLSNTNEIHPKKDNVLDLRKVLDDEHYELVSAGGNPITDEDWAVIKAILAKYPRKED